MQSLEAKSELDSSPCQETLPTGMDRPSGYWPSSLRILTITAAILALTVFTNVRLKRGKTLLPVAAQSAVSDPDQSRTIRLTGTTEAVHLRAITAPLLSGEHI